MSTQALALQTCAPCHTASSSMPTEEVQKLLPQIANWTLHPSGQKIQRKLTFKGFAKAVYCVNLSTYVSDLTGHHADVRFGWGYCEIDYTTHDVDGLTLNDFICAAKLDLLLDQ
ncbi:MAG TPA: 4a-hydroxytetrahydrobiopterin dehydratase [Oceanospirillaceae bacterium]|nr:4a-hydroxytetrahydrobiopterin dehydratase [Oceanospirillaceae bacterium]